MGNCLQFFLILYYNNIREFFLGGNMMYFRTVVGVLSHEAFIQIQKSLADIMRNKRAFDYEERVEVVSAAARLIYRTARDICGMVKNTVVNTVQALRSMHPVVNQPVASQDKYILSQEDTRTITDTTCNPPREVTVYRVIANQEIHLADGTVIAPGTAGGYVRHPKVLSQKDASWIGPDCIVAGKNARVFGDSIVTGSVICLGNVRIGNKSVLRDGVSIESTGPTIISGCEFSGIVNITGANNLAKLNAKGNTGAGIILNNVIVNSNNNQTNSAFSTTIEGWANLSDTTLADSNIKTHGADISGSRLQSATIMDNAQIKDSNITGSSLTGAEIESSTVNGSDINKARVTGSTLENANLKGNQRIQNIVCEVVNSQITDATITNKASVASSTVIGGQIKGQAHIENSVLKNDVVKDSATLNNVFSEKSHYADNAVVEDCSAIKSKFFDQSVAKGATIESTEMSAKAKVNGGMVLRSSLCNDVDIVQSTLRDCEVFENVSVSYSQVNDSKLMGKAHIEGVRAEDLTTQGNVVLLVNDGQQHEISGTVIDGKGQAGVNLYNSDLNGTVLVGEGVAHNSTLDGGENQKLTISEQFNIMDSTIVSLDENLFAEQISAQNSYLGISGSVSNCQFNNVEMTADMVNLENEQTENKTIILSNGNQPIIVDKTNELENQYLNQSNINLDHQMSEVALDTEQMTR